MTSIVLYYTYKTSLDDVTMDMSLVGVISIFIDSEWIIIMEWLNLLNQKKIKVYLKFVYIIYKIFLFLNNLLHILIAYYFDWSLSGVAAQRIRGRYCQYSEMDHFDSLVLVRKTKHIEFCNSTRNISKIEFKMGCLSEYVNTRSYRSSVKPTIYEI